jgi:hypothetical protein
VQKTLKKFVFIFIIPLFAFISKAQTVCNLLPPQFTINFGSGDVRDINTNDTYDYQRVFRSCPSDGYYSFSSYTISCFNDDWHTITEDHTAGDADGNMLLVNAGNAGDIFLKTPIVGLKSNTIYEISVWLVNLCKPTKKCPFPLLPDLSIRLETPDGKVVANIITGQLPRFDQPRWTRFFSNFTTPPSTQTLMLVMRDNIESGCGNDFALDDITFRECVPQKIVPVTTVPKTTTTTRSQNTSKPTTIPKQIPKKTDALPQKKDQPVVIAKPKTDTVSKTISVVKQNQKILPSAPLILKTRGNPLIRRIETEASEIKIELYDNGEIDGDTISIYHNNTLIRSHMRLSQKPITVTINVNASQPHHEVIMVAENLGSIPPNTSVMIITTPSNRYEVLISSSEQKNAKVVFDLKK